MKYIFVVIMLCGQLLVNAQNSKYNQAYDYYNNGELELAVNLFNEIEPSQLTNQEFYFLRGSCYSELGDSNKAIADLTKSINLDGTYANSYYQRGFSYFGSGESDKALSDFTTAIKLDPSFAEAFVNRGSVYYDLGNQQAACADWKTAIDLGVTMAEQLYEQLCN